MQRLIYGIQVQNNITITLANTKFKDNKIGNWLVPVSYMVTKVAKAFVVAKGNKNQEHGGEIRRMS